jgi:hypothetical protein
MAQWGAVTEQLQRSGVLLSGMGLDGEHTTTTLRTRDGERVLTDGPFAETKELLAGYWVWQVKSMDEAIEWAKRIPNPTGEHSVVEIRPVGEIDDFGEILTPELRARDAQLRSQVEGA